jgi:cell wall-associated NlpC family hydrolase
MMRLPKVGARAGVVALLVAAAGGLGSPLARADTTTSTTTVAPTTTTTTVAPPTTSPPTTTAPAPPPPTTAPTTAPTTTTVPPSTTTTTIPVRPWAANVPPPPAPPPITAPPDKVGQALKLQQQIVDQSASLDKLADQYHQAHDAAQAAAQALSAVQLQLATAKAKESEAAVGVTNAEAALREIAVDAYVHVVPTSLRPSAETLIHAYESGKSQAYGKLAIDTAARRVQQLHQAQKQLQDAQKTVESSTKQAAADAAAANKAEADALTAVETAAVQQQQLITTLGQVQGDLVQLVAAEKTSAAIAAFDSFSISDSLDFSAQGPLQAPVSQTQGAIQAALAQLGKPYVWGATGPDSFDCSGLMQWSWAQVGIRIPRVANDQQSWATPVPISQIQPGDFVFFGNPAHHVGMYIGNGLMVDAPHTGAYVEVTSVWWSDLAGFGRVHQP